MPVVIANSGGLDSALMLQTAIARFGKRGVQSIRFIYPANNNFRERKAGDTLDEYYGIKTRRVTLDELFECIDSPFFEEGEKNLANAFVPGRNLIFVSILVGIAQSYNCKEVWIGAHKGNDLYPDGRPPFVHALNAATQTGYGVQVTSPFLDHTKKDIVAAAVASGVPLQFTWSCYGSGPIACGRCGACQDRLHAFAANGVDDPLEYVTRKLIPQER